MRASFLTRRPLARALQARQFHVSQHARRFQARRRGLTVLYIGLILLVLLGFVSMAVDIGRVRLARAEIQTAADAAARAGVRSLPISSQKVLDAAVDAALANPVIDAKDGGPNAGSRVNPGLPLEEDEDVEFGTWNAATREFTEIVAVGGGQDERRRATAVRAWGRRWAARDNPIPLIFAPAIGIFSTDIEREAIATIRGGVGTGFGFIGLDWVDSNGNGAVVDSMVNGTNGSGGGVASDGNVNLLNGDVYGDARPGMNGGVVTQGPNSQVTGWMAPLDLLLRDQPQFQPVTTPNNAIVYTPPSKKNDDWIIPPTGATTSTDPANPKRYFLNEDLELKGNNKISIRGFVELYVNGNVKIDGNHVVNDGSPPNPSQFTINVVKAGTTVDIGGNANQYSHIHAPLSDVKIHGSNNMHYYGWITGKTLLFIGGSNLHYDESRVVTPRPYEIRLVR